MRILSQSKRLCNPKWSPADGADLKGGTAQFGVREYLDYVVRLTRRSGRARWAGRHLFLPAVPTVGGSREAQSGARLARGTHGRAGAGDPGPQPPRRHRCPDPGLEPQRPAGVPSQGMAARAARCHRRLGAEGRRSRQDHGASPRRPGRALWWRGVRDRADSDRQRRRIESGTEDQGRGRSARPGASGLARGQAYDRQHRTGRRHAGVDSNREESELIAAATRALIEAKQSGRNMIVSVADSSA